MKKKEETRSIRDCNLRENFVAALRRTSSNRVCLNGLTDQTGLILPSRKSFLDRCKAMYKFFPQIVLSSQGDRRSYVLILESHHGEKEVVSKNMTF